MAGKRPKRKKNGSATPNKTVAEVSNPPKKKLKNTTSPTAAVSDLHTQAQEDENMYETLSELSDDASMSANTLRTQNTIKKFIRDGDGRILHPGKPSTSKLQPIVVLSENMADIKTRLSSIDCMYKQTQKGIRVDVKNPSDHQKVQSLLTTQLVPFFMYHTSKTRPIKVVLFGLQEMEDSEMTVKLHALDVKPEKVAKLALKKPRYDRQAVYMLTFKPGTTSMDQLRQIKGIDNVIVRWDRYRPRKFDKIPQCRQCQRLGHASENCRAPPRCLVCAEQHLTSGCPKKVQRKDLKQQQVNGVAIDRSFVKCALCGGSHTANYLGCNERKEYIKVQQKVTRENPAKKRNTGNFNLNDLNDFPAFSSARTQQQSQQIPVSYAEVIPQKANDEMLTQVQQILATMQQMMQQMSEMMSMLITAMRTQVPGPSLGP